MITRRTDNFTGYIDQGKNEDKIYFHAQDKVFYFISKGTGFFADISGKTLTSQDSFLYGRTTDGYQIAIYTGTDEQNIYANYKLRPGLYVISRANACRYDMSKFQAIEFIGGTLNDLYEQERITTKYEEGNGYIKTYPEVRDVFNINVREYNCKLIIKNKPSETSPSKMDLVVRFEFEQELPLAEFKLFYNTLIEACRFMTNRSNVGFDTVNLYQIDDKSGKWFCFSEGFIDYRCAEFSKKTFKRNILFKDLSSCIGKLFSLVSADTERKATYLFNFYAESDEDYFVLTDDKIKNICSSIECELDFVKDLAYEENENLKELMAQVKDLIVKHKESDKKLEEKTYDNILGSMSHWEMPNSRKIYLLYSKNAEYMEILKAKTKLSCSEEDIAEFVKYRNDITHGRYRTLGPTVATTAYTLMALSYCCFLQRIGMSNGKLKELFENNKIGG